ncbi:chloride channel protein [Butyrivibrio sp. MB2005]|uniref:chloride channel protein n=1 Tax=Butyrivibrio sp. MB2005 TaxID=1280678 RepID=UPI000422DC32|nr:chloride channel protein [Butyrivibrio sp. MB2005]
MSEINNNDNIEPHYKHQLRRLMSTLKWLVLGILIGVMVGAVGAAFFHGIKFATEFRKSHEFVIFLLPFAGLLIVLLYRLSKDFEDTGTNLVITTISAGDHLPIRKIPLIFVATILTHLCGGSAGRESAALQLGGSMGHNFGKLIHLDDDDCKIITMCGMSAAFAALFGTPMAAAFLAMEIESIGVMYYAALIPCVLSALVSSSVAMYFGTVPDVFTVSIIPEFTVVSAIRYAVLAVLCAVISILFCIVMKKSGELYKKFFKNPYIRIFVGGCLVVLLTIIVGNNNYNGAGMDVIELAIDGRAPYAAFALKMLFTAVTMGAGYKGGEIVPALFIGATFGCLYSQIFGFNSALCAAIGMGALFCGITNCPISSLLLCFEMFGYNGMPYYLLAIALSYTFSGYYGVYGSQKIMYSKFHNKYINQKTR